MKKILIIEDNAELADNYALLLREKKFDVHCAYSGVDALKSVTGDNYNIILCDIMLPDINGYKLLGEIKKITKEILPVFIFITAKTQRQDLRKGMELGADDYLTKPFTFQELLNAINAQLNKRKNRGLEKTDNKIISVARSAESRDVLKYDEYFFFDDKRNPGFKLISTIVLIKSMKDYSHIIFNDEKKIIMRKPMKYWEKRLPPEYFSRIHKQTIVNLNYIDKLETLSSNRYQIKINSLQKEIIVSQRFSKKLREIFS